MPEPHKYTIRPFSRPSRPDLKDVFHVNLSAPALLSLKLRAGSPCQLRRDGGSVHTAIAWAAVEKIQDTVVQTSKLLQELYSLKLGDKVTIERSESPILEASRVECEEVGDVEKLHQDDRHFWEWMLKRRLLIMETLGAGLQIDVDVYGETRKFRLTDLGIGNPLSGISRFTESSTVTLSGARGAGATNEVLLQLETLEAEVGALRSQIEKINGLLRRLDTDTMKSLPHFMKPSQGILIYGPKGTGKSLLVNQLAKCGWKKVIRWTTKDAGTAFKSAVEHQPCLIIIDHIEHLAPSKAAESHSSHSYNIRTGFESISNCQVLVVAETRHPNEMDESLRAPARFGMEIEIPVPKARDRSEILRAIRGPCPQPSDVLIEDMALRTHGYVGADLFALLRESGEIAYEEQEVGLLATKRAPLRENETQPSPPSLEHRIMTTDGNKSPTNGHFDLLTNGVSSLDQLDNKAILQEFKECDEVEFVIQPVHINLALSRIRPTAMQEVFLETPNVRWSDIGGNNDLKRRLRLAVERPLKNAHTMAQLNLKPKKGVLLYGPPGCSKTLLVKALATEAGLNFLAVKGAELISMYVGESERAVREIFRKARAASPSIIFFDEIDSIASSRSGGVGGGGQLNVLTTLLNEMDGFEELRNVMVVAATNKPNAIDPALLRPGRLDEIIYVGPPDFAARQEILQLWFNKSRVQEDAAALFTTDSGQPLIPASRNTLASGAGSPSAGNDEDAAAPSNHQEPNPLSYSSFSSSSSASVASKLAHLTAGYSGAELVSICSTAAEYAMDDDNRNFITWSDLQRALEYVPRGITSDIRAEYETWSQARRRKI